MNHSIDSGVWWKDVKHAGSIPLTLDITGLKKAPALVRQADPKILTSLEGFIVQVKKKRKWFASFAKRTKKLTGISIINCLNQQFYRSYHFTCGSHIGFRGQGC